MRRLPTCFLSEQRRQLWKINSISRMPWDSFCSSLCNPLCLWNIFTPRTEIRMSLCRISSRGQKVHWHNFLICCCQKKKKKKVQHKIWWWQVERLVDWVQKSVFCIMLVEWLSVRHGNQWWWWWEMVDRTWEEYYKLSEPGFKSQLCYWIEMSPSSSASLSPFPHLLNGAWCWIIPALHPALWVCAECHEWLGLPRIYLWNFKKLKAHKRITTSRSESFCLFLQFVPFHNRVTVFSFSS